MPEQLLTQTSKPPLGAIIGLSLALLGWSAGLAADSLVLQNARLFDGTEDFAVPVSSIVVANGRIAAIHAAGDALLGGPAQEGAAGQDASSSAAPAKAPAVSATAPAATNVIDLEGAFLMPGLVDTHVHLSFDFEGMGMYFPKSDAEYAEYVNTRMREKLAELLRQGFTTIMSPGDFWPQIIDVRERQKSGDLQGPRILVSGGIFTAPDGHPAVGICSGSMVCAAIAPVADLLANVGICEGREYCARHVAVEVDKADAARAWVRSYAESGVDQLKITYVEPDGPKLSPEVAEAIIDEANRIGLPALVHAMDARDVNQLVEWGVDGFVHPPSITADKNGDLLGAAGRKGLAVAITLGTPEIMAETFGEPSEEDLAEFSLTKANIESMIAFGAKPVLGSDLPGFPADKVLRTTIAALSSLGLSNAEVLRAATRDAAQGLLALEDVGTLEVGNVADMIVMQGNPLQDLDALQNLSMVIQGGSVVFDQR